MWEISYILQISILWKCMGHLTGILCKQSAGLMVYKGLDKSSIAGCVRMTSLKELHCIARKRPIRPANAEIRHNCGKALL